jgi:hypothetical protein
LFVVTAAVLIFGAVTAPALSCWVPTLFGRICWSVAQLVSPRATSNARRATTSAGEGLNLRRALIPVLLSTVELARIVDLCTHIDLTTLRRDRKVLTASLLRQRSLTGS